MSQLPFDVPTDLPLQGETLVFTGRLWSVSRKEARAAVERLGGACDDDVTPRTTLLVVGADTYPAGVPDEQGLFPEGSFNAAVATRLAVFAEVRRAFAATAREDAGEDES